jgi:hypothetical protein
MGRKCVVAGNAGAQPEYSEAGEREQVLLSVLAESRSLRIRTLAAPDLIAGASVFGLTVAASHASLPVLVDPASLRHLLAALKERGWRPVSSRRGGLLPPLAIELTHPQRQVTLALYAFVPGQRSDPEAAFDLLWDKRVHRTLQATTVPVIDPAVLARTADAHLLPSAPYACARLQVDCVSDPMRWCLAYAEATTEHRKQLRSLAMQWRRDRGVVGDFGSAAWRITTAFLGARRRWAQAYGL